MADAPLEQLNDEIRRAERCLGDELAAGSADCCRLQSAFRDRTSLGPDDVRLNFIKRPLELREQVHHRPHQSTAASTDQQLDSCGRPSSFLLQRAWRSGIFLRVGGISFFVR